MIYKFIKNFILILFAFIAVLPLYWMTVTAFSEPSLTAKIPPSVFPQKIYFENLKEVLRHPDIIRWTFNSMIVSLIVTLVYTYICSLAGFVLAKYRFKGKKIIFALYISSMMIPFQVIIVPLYILCSKLGMNDSYAGLIFPALAGPFGVFLMKQLFTDFPYEIIEAAKLDGCSDFRIFNKIAMPVNLSGMTVLATFTFIGQWNSFLWPLIITESVDMKVLQAGIVHLQSAMPMRHAYLMSASLYSAIPVIIIFFIFQKYFLKGIKIS
jgi:multiple sugar transport system permease protein